MAKIYVTAAESNQLSAETEIKIRMFTRDGVSVWDFDAEAWGVRGTVTAANALSAAITLGDQDYKEFGVEIPAPAHNRDIRIQICKTDGTCMFAGFKNKKDLHVFNPGLMQYRGMVKQ